MSVFLSRTVRSIGSDGGRTFSPPCEIFLRQLAYRFLSVFAVLDHQLQDREQVFLATADELVCGFQPPVVPVDVFRGIEDRDAFLDSAPVVAHPCRFVVGSGLAFVLRVESGVFRPEVFGACLFADVFAVVDVLEVEVELDPHALQRTDHAPRKLV